MKILKNIGRKNKIIKSLREHNEWMYQQYRRADEDLASEHRTQRYEREELEKLRSESYDLLDIKDRYYKLLQHIKIDDREVMEIIN